MKRFSLLYAAPLLLFLGWIALPLARGTETLFLRDTFNAHLPMKWSEAEALRRGTLPLLWALLLLGGDPLMALLALFLAGFALVMKRRAELPAGEAVPTLPAVLVPGLAALGAGTLLAAPQIVEFVRILPLSFRGHW